MNAETLFESVPVPLLDGLPEGLCWKGKIAYLAYRLKQLEQDADAYPVGHIFRSGEYIREVQYPAGVVVIGRPHKLGHECRLLSGELLLCREHVKTYFRAPAMLRTQPGDQLVVYTVTAITAITVHPNPEGIRDVDLLEAKWFEPQDPTLELGRAAHLRLEQQAYVEMLARTEDVAAVRYESERSWETAPVVPFLEREQSLVYVWKSPIHGQGLFSAQAFRPGQVIVPLKREGIRTAAGRFTNHSYDPNTEVERGKNLYLLARRAIKADEELTVDYRVVWDAAAEKPA